MALTPFINKCVHIYMYMYVYIYVQFTSVSLYISYIYVDFGDLKPPGES